MEQQRPVETVQTIDFEENFAVIAREYERAQVESIAQASGAQADLGSVSVDAALMGPDLVAKSFENLSYAHLSKASDVKLGVLSTHQQTQQVAHDTYVFNQMMDQMLKAEKKDDEDDE
jgi:hypothetical protein